MTGDISVFDAYGRYYDLLYHDKDYAAEVDYLAGLLDAHGIAGPELLEFGSGTGKHGRLLAARGYRVTGAVHTLTETHPMRHCSLPELDLLAAGAGFERLRAEAFLTGDPHSE